MATWVQTTTPSRRYSHFKMACLHWRRSSRTPVAIRPQGREGLSRLSGRRPRCSDPGHRQENLEAEQRLGRGLQLRSSRKMRSSLQPRYLEERLKRSPSPGGCPRSLRCHHGFSHSSAQYSAHRRTRTEQRMLGSSPAKPRPSTNLQKWQSDLHRSTPSWPTPYVAQSRHQGFVDRSYRTPSSLRRRKEALKKGNILRGVQIVQMIMEHNATDLHMDTVYVSM